MSDVNLEYASSAAFTITLNSLATSATAARESTAIDNGTNLYIDALVEVTLKIASGTPANDKAAHVYAYASEDGTNYTGQATGSDAALTLLSPTNLVLLGTVAMPTASKTYIKTFGVAEAFGGILPRKWGIVVLNYCGINLDSTGNSAAYSGIIATVV